MNSLKTFEFVSLLEQQKSGGEDSFGSWVRDVKFVVKDADGKVAGEIQASKVLLSLVSEVFRTQFFGTMSEEKRDTEDDITTIVIEDTSFTAFRSLIGYIYSGDEASLRSLKDLNLLFEIFQLADKYLLFTLKTLVKTIIEKFPLSLHNYAAVFKIIAHHENLLPFEDLCRELSGRCMMAVNSEWTAPADCIKFWSQDSKDDTATKLMLVQKMSQLCFTCSPPRQ